MNMAKRPVPRYDFKAFGAAIKAARLERKESRKKVCDEMYLSPRYLANIENKGKHPSLQIFFELMLRYNISVDQFLLERPTGKDTSAQLMFCVGWHGRKRVADRTHSKESCRLNSQPNGQGGRLEPRPPVRFLRYCPMHGRANHTGLFISAVYCSEIPHLVNDLP